MCIVFCRDMNLDLLAIYRYWPRRVGLGSQTYRNQKAVNAQGSFTYRSAGAKESTKRNL